MLLAGPHPIRGPPGHEIEHRRTAFDVVTPGMRDSRRAAADQRRRPVPGARERPPERARRRARGPRPRAPRPAGSSSCSTSSEMLAERLPLLPPMRWRLAEVPFGLDYPYWVDDPDFDLDFHVRELALPPPGTDEKLAEQVARIFARPLDRARPLWELYLIHGLEDGLVAMLTKIHHAAIDGLSGAEIMGVLFDLAAGRPRAAGRRVPGRQRRAARRARDARSRSARAAALPAARRCARCPARCPTSTRPRSANLPGAEALARTSERAAHAPFAASARAASSSAPTYKPPRTSFNGRVSPHRRFVFGQLSLDEVKEVKNAPRLHGQRRRRRDLRRRRAPLADLARRAPGRPAGRPDPRLGAQRGPAGDLRQPDHADERARCSPTSPIRSSACG